MSIFTNTVLRKHREHRYSCYCMKHMYCNWRYQSNNICKSQYLNHQMGYPGRPRLHYRQEFFSTGPLLRFHQHSPNLVLTFSFQINLKKNPVFKFRQDSLNLQFSFNDQFAGQMHADGVPSEYL